MIHNWKDVLLVLLTFVFLVTKVCKSQSITTCENNTLMHIEANETDNYIHSYGYPNNYAYTAFGDCRILITTTMDRIKITIVEFNKRTNENTLNFFSGTSSYHKRLGTEKNITKSKEFVSTGKNVYITHWSYGNQNNAFIISYMAFNKGKDEGGENLTWIAGPIVGSIVFFCIVFDCVKKKQQKAQAQATQVTEVTTQQNTTPTNEQTSNSTTQANQAQNNTNSNAEESRSGATSTQATSTTQTGVSLEPLPEKRDEPFPFYQLPSRTPPPRVREPETSPPNYSPTLPGQTEIEPFPAICSPPPPYSMVSDSTVLPDTYPLYMEDGNSSNS